MEGLTQDNSFLLIPLKLHVQFGEMENEHWEVTQKKTVLCCKQTFIFLNLLSDLPLYLVMCCLNPGLALQASLQQSDFPGDTCGRVFIIWKPEGDSKIDEAAMNREPED